MKTKSVLVIAAVAMFALVIGQVQAESINVPNGEFQIYKPGTDYTVLASFPAGNVYAQQVGDNLPVLNGDAEYSDGTTGGFVDLPGWVVVQGNNDILNNGVDGSVGMNAFAAWGGDCRRETADSLGTIQGGATYTISAMINGGVSDGPLAFYLLADGVEMTPSSVVDQVVPVTAWQQISRTFDATALAGHAGESITIIIGVKDENDIEGRMIWDNITLEVTGLMYPSPEDGETVLVDASLELSWTNLPNDSNDVYVDVWFGTEPNELHPAYDMTLVVDAGENTEAVLVDASAPDTYYWQINSYLNGAGHINDANMIEGGLLLFYAVDDVAPTVEIVTLDHMTWSGEGVPLDATVTDDAVSALTIEWSADLPTGISAAFNPGNDVADTTVTLTKLPYSEAKIANPSFEMVTSQSAITTSRDTWGHYDRPPGSGYALQYVPNTTYHFPDGDDQVPDGNIICRTATAIGESRPDGLAMILDEKFDPSANYTLTVAVGHPHAVPDDPAYNDDTWRGYLVQLVAGGEVESTGSGADNISGGTVIAEDDNGVTIAPRTWETSTVTYTPGSEFAALAGQPLQIRLLAVDDPDPAYFSQTKVFYDNVVLTADPPFSAPTGVETVTVTVAVSDEANPTPDTASIEIDVYDDACHLARVGEGKSAVTDFNANCITGLEDLAVVAAAWLDDYAPTGPVDR